MNSRTILSFYFVDVCVCSATFSCPSFVVSSVRNSLILWWTLTQPSTHKSIPWVEWREREGEGRSG